MQTPRWDDLALFASVARHGALAPAATEMHVSVATLSRRMRALEDAMGQALFAHGAQGYTLTGQGRAVAERVARMEREAAGIADDGPAQVRITAGTWTALDLAERLGDYWTPSANWVPHFVQSEASLDIGRREVEIGVTNRAPDRPWLAGRRVGYVDFAAYAASPKVQGWIGGAAGGFLTRSQRWLEETHRNDIVARANASPVAAAMAEAGVGRVILPIFAAERRALVRLGPPIAELRTEEWLIAHHDARHVPPIRAALSALTRALRSRPKMRYSEP